MARRILPKYGVGPVNDGEKKVINFLLNNLSPQGLVTDFNNFGKSGDEYIVIPNIDIPDNTSRQPLDIDCILIAPHCIYTIEIKDWRGKITGDDYEWLLNDRVYKESPISLINRKSKVLRGLIVHENINLNNKFWCQHLIIISDENTNISIEGAFKDLVFKTDKSLINYLTNAEKIGKHFVKRNTIKHIQREIAEIITRKGKGQNNKSLKIQGHEVIEEVFSRDGLTEYLARPVIGNKLGSLKKLRVFTLPLYSDEAQKKAIEIKIYRDIQALSTIGNDTNILGFKSHFDYESDKIVEILDWYETGTLRSLMNKGNLTFNKKLEIIKGIASGLKKAHENNIFHRDLRPENILMDDALTPKIMNFDYAYITSNDQYTVWHTDISTMDRRYLPPELSEKKDNTKICPSSDLYGLGVIFYELICGFVPFSTSEEFENNGGILTDKHLPSEHYPDCSNEIDLIISKLYTTDIENRYQSANEFINDITKITENINNKPEINNNYLYRKYKPNDETGDYRIIKHLGGGNFSDVYLAWYSMEEKNVALKIYKHSITNLIDEVRLLRKLKHKNIVNIEWSGRLENTRVYYITMEYLEGNTLNELCFKKEEEILQAALEIADALEYLHSGKDTNGQKIYHRDIKPDNIIWVENRGAVLIDFNIAKDSSNSLTYAGTRPFMAPDLKDNQQINWNDSGDTFALGVTIYLLACGGEHPYPNEKPSVNVLPKSPKETVFGKALSDEFSKFLMKAVSPLTSDRFQTAKEFKSEIEKLLALKRKVSQSNNFQINFTTDIKMKWKAKEEFLEYRFFQNKEEIETEIVESLLNHNQDLYIPFSILKNLKDSGRIPSDNYSLKIPYKIIYGLSDEDKESLNLPGFFNFSLFIESSGTLEQKDFSLNSYFFDEEKNRKFIAKITGAIILVDNQEFLISENQFEVLKTLSMINIPDRTVEDNIFIIKELKFLSQPEVTFDQYLTNIDVESADLLIQVSVNKENIINIQPVFRTSEEDITDFDNIQEKEFIEYKTDNNKRKTIICLTENQKREINRIKTFNSKNFSESIQGVFNSGSILETQKFEDTIKKGKIGKSLVEPFIFLEEVKWFPGILFRSVNDELNKVKFYSQEELNTFKKFILEPGNSDFAFLESLQELRHEIISTLEKLNRQFENQSKPITKNFKRRELLILNKQLTNDYSRLSNSQIKSLSEIEKYIDQGEKIIVLSGIKGSGKTYLLKHILQKHGALENYLLHKRDGEDNIDYQAFLKLKNSEIIAIDDGESNKEWFKKLRIELSVYKIRTTLISSFVSNLSDIQIPVIFIEQQKKEEFFPQTIAYVQPPNIKEKFELFDFQKEGIEWLQFLYCNSYPGAIMADQSGLGKKVQSLAFIQWHYYNKNEDSKFYLIITSQSRLDIWIDEYDKFFYNNNLPMVHIFNEENLESEEETENKAKVFIITDKLLLKSPEVFSSREWGIILVDNQDQLKINDSLLSFTLKMTKADFKISVFDELINKNFEELYSVFDFTVPGLLEGNKNSNNNSESLLNDVGFYLKKRTKTEILNNRKIITKIESQISDEQKKIYQIELLYLKSVQAHDKDKDQHISILKDISEHPILIDRNYNLANYDENYLINSSGKLEAIVNLLKEAKEKEEKVIILSNNGRFHKILSKIIFEKFNFIPNILSKDNDIDYNKKLLDRFEETNGFYALISNMIDINQLGLKTRQNNNIILCSRIQNYFKEEQIINSFINITDSGISKIYIPLLYSEYFDTIDVLTDKVIDKQREDYANSLLPIDIADFDIKNYLENYISSETGLLEYINLTLSDIDLLDPFLFEAFIALMYKNKGFKVSLTQKSNDKGVDVLALSEHQNLLIQAKHSRKSIGGNGLGEILKAVKYYENIHQKIFEPVIATNQELNSNALEMAKVNKIDVISRTDIKNYLENNEINLNNLITMEKERNN